MNRIVSFLSLFSSASTLLCCALPALFVSLGFGAAFAGLVTNIPQLIWLSEHKIPLFVVGGLLLGFGAVLQWRSSQLTCPVGVEFDIACKKTKDWSGSLYYISVVIYLVGAFFAFVLGHI